MLRLRDARTGELADVLPRGRRQLRILVSAPGELRVHLTGDLIRRAAEAARLLPTVTELLPATLGAPGPSAAMLRAAWHALNIHPPQDTLTAPVDPLAGIPLYDIGVDLAGETSSSDVTDLARLWVQVAAGNHEAAPGEEPLAIRLSLLRRRYWEPASDGDAATGAATETLARWRELTAQWARSPSGAMSHEHAAAVTDALGNDLDTVTALRALDELADNREVPDGVKFETFAAADRLLGLDLARDVGT
ncbi:MAG TPA: hypothetical protein VI365_10285 [Trebonia sp.]